MRPTTPRVRARVRLSALAAGCVLAMVAGGGAVAAASSASAAPHASNAATAAINLPSGLAMDKGNLWVTNKGNNSVTEISVSGQKVLQHLTASSYGFSSPSAIIGGGNNIWVTNEGNNSVDVISVATGTLVKRLTAATFGFNKPVALTFDGPNVFVVNNGGSVTEIGRYRFGLIHHVTGAKYQFDDPVAITSSGSSLWVGDETAGTQGAVTEFSAQTGALENVVTGTSSNGLDVPAGVVYAGGFVWASDEAGYADTAITASSAAVDQTFSDGSASNRQYGFNHPTAETTAAGKVYVVDPPGTSPMVTSLDANAGADSNFYECDTNSPDPDFSMPDAVTVDGNEVFVASTYAKAWGPGNIITEFSLTGGNNNGAGAVGWLHNGSGSSIVWSNTQLMTGGQG